VIAAEGAAAAGVAASVTGSPASTATGGIASSVHSADVKHHASVAVTTAATSATRCCCHPDLQRLRFRCCPRFEVGHCLPAALVLAARAVLHCSSLVPESRLTSAHARVGAGATACPD
jgi:hypothetical protein